MITKRLNFFFSPIYDQALLLIAHNLLECFCAACPICTPSLITYSNVSVLLALSAHLCPGGVRPSQSQIPSYLDWSEQEHLVIAEKPC